MTKKKEKETAVIAVSPELQKNLDIILEVKKEADKIGNNCLQIIITDEATLSVAQQNLSSASQLAKTIEAKRKEIKQPYLDAGSLIDDTCAQISELVEKGILHIKTQIKMWDIKRLEEAKKAAEELAKKQEEERLALEAETKKKKEQSDFYNKVIASLNQMYTSCTTPDQCDEQRKYIIDKFPPADQFGDLWPQALAQAENIVKLIEAKKQQLLSANTLSEGEKELIKAKEELIAEKARIAQKEAELKAKEEAVEAELKAKKLAEENEKERQRLAMEAETGRLRGVKYLWKFELVDKSKLIEDWISLDETKAKEYLKTKKDDLKDGEIVNGVKFYKEQSVGA